MSCRRTRSPRIAHRALGAADGDEHDARSASSEPISSSVAPVPPSPVKKSESRMIAPKSAIEPAAITSWPSVEPLSPASLSTGISTPSEVATSAIATSSGASTSPPPSGRPPTTQRERERQREARARRAEAPARAAARSRSRGRRGRAGTRARASRSTAIVSSISTQPSTLGPTTIPATISSTDRGQPHAREQPEHERRAERDRDDDQKSGERGHALRSRATAPRVTRGAAGRRDQLHGDAFERPLERGDTAGSNWVPRSGGARRARRPR